LVKGNFEFVTTTTIATLIALGVNALGSNYHNKREIYEVRKENY